MYLVNKKVVVTGCSGFIGFHLSNSLLDSDHTVIGIDNLSGGYLENVHKDVIFYNEDIANDISFIFYFNNSSFRHYSRSCSYR